MDFYESLAKHLTTNLELKSVDVDGENQQVIKFKESDNENCDICLLDGASSPGDRYFGTTNSYNMLIQVIVKNKNQKTAYDDSMKIYQELDSLPRLKVGELFTIKSSDDSFIFRSSEGYTLPRMIEITEHKAYIYAFLIKADILVNKK